MLGLVASLSGICLLLATASWDSGFVTTGSSCPCHNDWDATDVYVSGPEGVDEVLGCCEEVGCDCGNLIFPCPLCPWAVDLRNAGVIERLTYRTTRSIRKSMWRLSQVSVDNSVWVLILILSNGSLIVFGKLCKWGKKARNFACQKNTDDSLKLKESKLKHRCELEQMARAIEFLQKKYRRQAKMLEKRELTVDLVECDARNYYRSCSVPRKGQIEVEIPTQDYEWN